MNHEASKDLVFFILIAGRKNRGDLSNAISEAGGRIINLAYAKGSIKSSYLLDMLGLIHEEDKVVISSVIPSSKTDEMMTVLIEKFEFDKPNTGIAFTIPIDKMSF